MESKLELFFYERSCNLAKKLVKDKRILWGLNNDVMNFY